MADRLNSWNRHNRNWKLYSCQCITDRFHWQTFQTNSLEIRNRNFIHGNILNLHNPTDTDSENKNYPFFNHSLSYIFPCWKFFWKLLDILFNILQIYRVIKLRKQIIFKNNSVHINIYIETNLSLVFLLILYSFILEANNL